MSEKRKKEASARAILFRFELVVFLPLLGIIIAFMFYCNHIYRERILKDMRTTIAYFGNEQREKMSNIEHTLSNIVANDYSFQHLAYVTDTTRAYDDVYTVKEKFLAIMDNVDLIDGLGVYADSRIPYYYATFRDGIDWSEHSAVRRYIREEMPETEGAGNGRWRLLKLDGEWYLINVFGYKRVYCFCVIRAANISLCEPAEGGNRYLLLTNDSELLAFPEIRETFGIRPEESAEEYTTKKRFSVVQEDFPLIGCRIIHAAPYQGILNWQSGFLFALLMLGVFGVILLFGQRYLRRNIVTEAEQMITMVARAREGGSGAETVREGGLQEYRQGELAVNEMVDQITSLKTLAYNRLAEANRVQLQYYEIQIRPHFFLNCLTNLYSLSASGNTRAAQEFILALSDYLRSVFRNHESIISLRDELTSVRYYIRLQEMISANAPSFTAEVEPELEDFRVPPMSILTFVENSVRYLKQSEGKPEIAIKIRRLVSGEESVVNISIMDSGMGFAEDVLARLNTEDGWKAAEHVGIYNIQQRFRLLYGDACSFFYSNRGGACVDIYVSQGGQVP